MLGINLAKEIVENVGNTVKRVRWTNEEIDKNVGKRRAREIIESENTHYMNPCLDLTLASLLLLKERGVNHALVIEEHAPTRDYPFNRLHFVAEFSDNTGSYVINYAKPNLVTLSQGVYTRHPEIEQRKLIRLTKEVLDLSSLVHVNLGAKSVDDLGDIFEGYKLASNVDRLKEDNTPIKYQAYLKKKGHNLQVRIESQLLPAA